MRTQDSGTSPESRSNRTSRTLIIVIGSLILIAFAAAMMVRSSSTRQALPNTGNGSQTEQH